MPSNRLGSFSDKVAPPPGTTGAREKPPVVNMPLDDKLLDLTPVISFIRFHTEGTQDAYLILEN